MFESLQWVRVQLSGAGTGAGAVQIPLAFLLRSCGEKLKK